MILSQSNFLNLLMSSFFETTPYYHKQPVTSSIPHVPLPPLVSPGDCILIMDNKPPLKVYTRRNKHHEHTLSPSLSSLDGDPPQQGYTPSNLDLSITLRKEKWSITLHPIANHVSYDHLSSSHRSFTMFLSSVSIPKNYQEALSNPK